MSNPQHEPTMEEILASIRKIISEDAPEAPVPPPAPVPSPASVAPAAVAVAPPPVASVVEEDVLELTQEVPAEPEPVKPAPAPVPEAMAVPEPEPAAAAPAPEPEPEVVFQTAEEPARAPAPEPPPAVHEGIFSERTRGAMEETFAKIPAIVPTPEPQPRPAPAEVLQPAPGGTIESAFHKAIADSFEPVLRKYLADNASGVIEGMKPIIREWMDEHFPALLEGAVRAEAERVAKSHIKR